MKILSAIALCLTALISSSIAVFGQVSDEAPKKPTHEVLGEVVSRAAQLVQDSKTIQREDARAANSRQAPPKTSKSFVVMRELLKDLPASDRHEFLDNLVLGDGRVVSGYLPPLMKTLNRDRLNETLDALSLGSSAAANKKVPSAGKRAPLLTLSELLKGVSPTVRHEFLDSMTFMDGAIVSADYGGLEKEIGAKDARRIIDALVAYADDGKPRNPKSLCGNGWCDDSKCTSIGSDPWKCLPKEKNFCVSTCK